jgi:hypothetical protein
MKHEKTSNRWCVGSDFPSMGLKYSYFCEEICQHIYITVPLFIVERKIRDALKDKETGLAGLV